MTEVEESRAPEGDPRYELLEGLAQGMPWVLIRVRGLSDGAFALALEVGGGVDNNATIRNLLLKTLRALPADAGTVDAVISVNVLRELVGTDSCRYDHNGWCQEHTKGDVEGDTRCPHEIATEALAEQVGA